MRTINTTFETFGASVLLLGYKGDSNATEILIDCGDALEEYEGTMAAMAITGPDEIVYPGDISLDEDGIVHWVVAARDCGKAGHGSARIDLVNDQNVVVASAEATTIIMKTNMQNIAPDQIADWTEAASVALQELRQALLDLYDGEDVSQANEAARQLAESGRVNAELLRVSAESARVAAESARVTAENARVSAETARVTAETARETAETARAAAETARASAETARVSEFSTIEANAQAALSYIGPSEDSSTASAAHATGSFFIYDGKLYEATADIAIGDTIASGTNCAQVPGGAMGEVSDLKNAIDDIPGFDILWSKGKRVDGSTSTVTFAWNADKTECTLNGTATSRDRYQVIAGSSTTMPDGIVAGKTYHVKAKVTENPNVFLGFYVHTSGGTSSMKYYRADGDLTVPNDTVALEVVVGVRKDYTATNDRVYEFGVFERQAVDEDELDELRDSVCMLMDTSSYSESSQFGISDMPEVSYASCTANKFSDKPDGISGSTAICIIKRPFNNSGSISVVYVLVRTNAEIYYGIYVDGTGLDSWEKLVKEKTFAYFAEDVKNLYGFNLLWDSTKRKDATVSTITFTWNTDKTECTLNGTASSKDRYQVIAGSSTTMPDGITAGNKYIVDVKVTANPAVYLGAIIHQGENTSTKYFRYPGLLDVPSDTTALEIVVGVRNGYTATNDRVYDFAIRADIDACPHVNLAKKYCDLSDQTIDGITFNWDANTATCHITGDVSSAVNSYLCNGPIPKDMYTGDRYLLRFRLSQNYDVKVVVAFANAAGQTIVQNVSYVRDIGDYRADVPFVVPEGAVSWVVRVLVAYYSSSTPFTIDVNIDKFELFKSANRKMDIPLIVAFIDDDATNDTYVTRYHDACCHNGIKGNYAVLTSNIDEGNTSAAKLLQYEDEGFGMLIHADSQTSSGHSTSYWSPKDGDGNYRPHTEEELTLCRTNLCKGMRRMQSLGFVNFRYWVTPGGNYQREIIEMAKGLGLNCLISTNNSNYNTMQDCTPWLIRRVSLRNTRSGDTSLADIKSWINKMVADGGGLLVVTTHFNDGWDETDTWDTTLDENGYPIGYARFNECVQYAISHGVTPMNFQQAWTYYAPILFANQSDYYSDY